MKSEFQFIRHIKDKFSLRYTGDDCAVLPKDKDMDLLITADLLMEDVDFRMEWATPVDIGHKSLAVSLSDIAAMGGTPTFAMLTLGVPEHLWNSDFLDEFYSGWHSLAQKYGVELVGGDVSASENLVIDSIVLGEVPANKAILRSGAKAGDAIFVSGTLGAAAGGLKLLESIDGTKKSEDLAGKMIAKQLRPEPQVALGKLLQQLGFITALIDVSDGLSSDLAHICDASGVGAEIDAASLPIERSLVNFFDDAERTELALHGGEDFELLFTVPPKHVDAIDRSNATHIGYITENVGKVEILVDEKKVELTPAGFSHF